MACHVIMSFSSFLNFLCHLRNNRITNLNSKCIFWTTTKVSYIILPLPPQCTCFNQLIAVHVLLKVAMLDYRRTNIAEALTVAASGTKSKEEVHIIRRTTHLISISEEAAHEEATLQTTSHSELFLLRLECHFFQLDIAKEGTRFSLHCIKKCPWSQAFGSNGTLT